MKYFELNFEITPYNTDAADLLMSMVSEAGLESFVETPKGFKGYVQDRLFDESLLNEIINYFPFTEQKINYTIEEAEDKNWNEEWEKNGFKPVNIANKVLITNEIIDDSNLFEYIIRIDPHQAFGTGTHQTTSMIVEKLLDLNLNGLRVLDAGCGTGILGLFAIMRGAEHVLAYDIDNWSVKNTQENAELNHIENITVKEGDVSTIKNEDGFDLILANINRNILLADMPHFRSVMRKGSKLILSGFYIDDIKCLQEKANDLGLSFVDMKTRDEWACLLFEL